ncbi:hypothetical protein EVAR_74256_1 [Eumeta japonica]|uniref:Uncharacterized protein n=1 Tax=Eumeta variegata TaxID=151549 RepID=A0A4C1SFJ4_EUMVA|nr:hypothetical protein EVAR_74256_1 [Eumeta japonica]
MVHLLCYEISFILRSYHALMNKEAARRNLYHTTSGSYVNGELPAVLRPALKGLLERIQLFYAKYGRRMFNEVLISRTADSTRSSTIISVRAVCNAIQAEHVSLLSDVTETSVTVLILGRAAVLYRFNKKTP